MTKIKYIIETSVSKLVNKNKNKVIFILFTFLSLNSFAQINETKKNITDPTVNYNIVKTDSININTEESKEVLPKIDGIMLFNNNTKSTLNKIYFNETYATVGEIIEKQWQILHIYSTKIQVKNMITKEIKTIYINGEN